MKTFLKLILLLIAVSGLAGCGLASGIAKDFGGYGEQLSGKIQPKEYDSYDSSVKFGGPDKSPAPIIQEVNIKNKFYKGTPRENDLAVVIGIEQYRGIPSSDFSSTDAAYMKAHLKAIGFEDRNIMFLANDQAALTDIRKALESWLVNRVQSDSTVFVYYSGHGAPDPSSGKAYIVPFDGDPNYLSTTAYPLSDLYTQLERLGAAKTIVILDACFSGAGGRSVLAKGARALVRMEKASPATRGNVIVLSSTQGSQISSSSPEKKHGIFTYYLMEALTKGKSDIADIYAYVKPKVENEARRMNVEQSPSLSLNTDQARGKFKLW